MFTARAIRRISQIFFLVLFLYLIHVTVYPLNSRIPVDLFVKLSPLVAGATMLAERVFIASMAFSIIVVGVTLLLGRVFCGWVCPLGTTLDASDRVFFREKRRKETRRLHRVKYYILGALVVSAFFTMQWVYLLDPLSLLTRTIVLAFLAPLQMVLRVFAETSYEWSMSGFRPLSAVGMWTADRLMNWQFVTGPQMYFKQALPVLAVFITIIGLNSISRRFWCKNLCPLGALLGLISRVPILKRAVSDSCIDCGKCIRDCKTTAIPENPRLTRIPECIECFNCVPVCPTDAVSFRFRPKPDLQPETRLSLPRRRVLQSAGVGLALAAMVKIDPGRKRAIGGTSSIKLSSQELIRPPGSVVEDSFVNRCVRCGQCMKVCPTNGLQPALHEAGIEGFWTPILVPRIGSCTENCNACGDLCPTDAITPFEIEEKKHIFIGTAVIQRDHCIAWYADKTCLVCDEYCSFKAIEWKEVDGRNRPFVDEKKCVGCGICEYACPIQPVAAIRVASFGDKRHMTREEQAEWAEYEEPEDDDGLPYW